MVDLKEMLMDVSYAIQNGLYSRAHKGEIRWDLADEIYNDIYEKLKKFARDIVVAVREDERKANAECVMRLMRNGEKENAQK